MLLLVAGGLAVALWYTREKEPPPLQVQPALLEGRPLLAAKRITIRNDTEGMPIVLESKDGRFHMTDPVRDLASDARLRSIAQAYDSALLILAYEGAQIDDKVLRETGLDKPRCVVEVEHEGKPPLRVEIGLDGLTGQDVFVRKGGILWRGGLALYTVLKATTSDLREQLLFQTQRPATVALARRLADGKSERLGFDLTGAVPRIVEPVVSRGDRGAFSSVLGQILSMQIGSFVQGAQGPRPDPDFVIDITGQQEPPETVRLWVQPGGSVLGQHLQRKIEFTASYQRYREAFEVPLERLRSRIVIPIAQDDRINRLEIDAGVGTKAIRLEPGLVSGDALRLVQPVSSECDPGQVSRLRGALQELTAERFVDDPGDLAALGLDEKRALKLSVRSDLMPAAITLLFGKDEGDLTWCKRADEGYVVGIKKASVDAFREDWAKLCSKQVQKITAAPFELASERAGKKRVWKRSREDGEWREAGQKEPVEKVKDVVEVLSDLTAKATLDAEQLGTLPEPTVVELRSESGDGLATLKLYEKDGKVLAGTKRIPQLLYELKDRDGKYVLELVR
jgi:hypothetical protein